MENPYTVRTRERKTDKYKTIKGVRNMKQTRMIRIEAIQREKNLPII